MEAKQLRVLLEQVQRGEMPVDNAISALSHLPGEDLGFAVVDHHRALRVGFPEVIFGEGKSVAQIAAISHRILSHGSNAMSTRISPEKGAELKDIFPLGTYFEQARIFSILANPVEMLGKGTVAVVSAGTSDLPVAEEAAVTAELLGNEVVRIYDVGVAGLHRLLARSEALRHARVLIVIAGMEGALASVVGGLVARPVIAVPTSVGYGAAFGGVAALLGMLTSCASGVSVVNIDNGFGAAYTASLINRL